MTTKNKPLSSNLKGKNEHSLITQFDDRAAYTIGHPYLWDSEFPVPINFWSPTNALYGRIDNNKDPISPRPSKMKQISTFDGEDIYVLNFVADAFQDFLKYLKIKKSNKLLADDSFTTDWNPKRGWDNPDEYYGDYFNSIFNSFTTEYLDTTGKHKQITDFNSFYRIMLDDYLLRLAKDYPITRTGFSQSRLINPMSSGLCVEISLADHGDDEFKYQSFINNQNFKIYCLSASKFGFLVDKNAPWRLVANLNSKQMKSYIARYLDIHPNDGVTESSVNGHTHNFLIDETGYGTTTSIIQGSIPVQPHQHEIANGNVQPVQHGAGGNSIGVVIHGHNLPKKLSHETKPEEVYRSFFRKTIYDDLNRIKYAMFEAYNNYVTDYESVAFYQICKDKNSAPNVANQKSKLSSLNRYKINIDQFNEKYPDIFWLKVYFRIRLKELRAKVPQAKLIYNLKKLSILNKTIDFSKAFEYSEKYLKQFY